MRDRPLHVDPTLLQKWKVIDGISLMDLCGLVYSRPAIANKNLIQLILSFFYHLFRPKYYYYKGSSNIENDKPLVWICVAQANERLMDFFSPVTQNPNFCHCILTGAKIPEGKLSGYSVNKISISNRRIPFRLILGIFFHRQIQLREKWYLIDQVTIHYRLFYGYNSILEEMQPACIATDLDRYPTNLPIVLAAKAKKIPTISQVHGSIDPIKNYIPTIAEHIFIWGNYHLDRFQTENASKPKYHKLGNPKLIPNSNGKTNRTTTLVGLALTSLTYEHLNVIMEEFNSAMEDAYQGLIKMHPKDTYRKIQMITVNSNVKILDHSVSANSFLNDIDILVVRRSQIGSDALAYSIPVIVFDPIGEGDIQNGRFLIEHAGCPLVQNAAELRLEIRKLTQDKQYWESRINKQNVTCQYLFAAIGTESRHKMSNCIQEIIGE